MGKGTWIGAAGLLIGAALLSTACARTKKEAMVVVKSRKPNNGTAYSTGFFVAPHLIIGSKHAIEGSEDTVTAHQLFTGEEYEITGVWCSNDGRDICFIEIEPIEGATTLDVGFEQRASACAYGIEGPSEKLLRRCGIVTWNQDDTFEIKGPNAQLGISGGPCLVKSGRANLVVGVVSGSRQIKGNENKNAAGKIICHPLYESDII